MGGKNELLLLLRRRPRHVTANSTSLFASLAHSPLPSGCATTPLSYKPLKICSKSVAKRLTAFNDLRPQRSILRSSSSPLCAVKNPGLATAPMRGAKLRRKLMRNTRASANVAEVSRREFAPNQTKRVADVGPEGRVGHRDQG